MELWNWDPPSLPTMAGLGVIVLPQRWILRMQPSLSQAAPNGGRSSMTPKKVLPNYEGPTDVNLSMKSSSISLGAGSSHQGWWSMMEIFHDLHGLLWRQALESSTLGLVVPFLGFP